MFPYNDVKCISGNSCQIASNETPLRRGWREKTFSNKSLFAVKNHCYIFLLNYLSIPSSPPSKNNGPFSLEVNLSHDPVRHVRRRVNAEKFEWLDMFKWFWFCVFVDVNKKVIKINFDFSSCRLWRDTRNVQRPSFNTAPTSWCKTVKDARRCTWRWRAGTSGSWGVYCVLRSHWKTSPS